MIAGCAAALAFFALAPVAVAYRFAGPRWPNKTISVANEASRYGPAVRAAIKAWNRADVGVRFTFRCHTRIAICCDEHPERPDHATEQPPTSGADEHNGIHATDFRLLLAV